MTENKISQKEYLRRYLSNDKDVKKKKKKQKVVSSSTLLKRSQIIDDDVDLKNMRVLNDDEIELYQLDEDAPQIAGIVDERPPEVQAMEYYGNTKRWRVFGADDNGELTVKDNLDKFNTDLVKNDISDKFNHSSADDLKKLIKSSNIKLDNCDLKQSSKSNNHRNNENDSDLSPPRKEYDKMKSGNRKVLKNSDVSDLSPPRNSKDITNINQRQNKSSKKSKNSSDSDLSPPRNSRKMSKERKEHNSDSDLSPPRKSDKHDNISKYRGSEFSSSRNSRKIIGGSRRNSSGSDLSPPRYCKKSQDKREQDNSESDLSPPRNVKKSYGKRKQDNSDSDLSPPRNSGKYQDKRRKNSSDSDLSLPRNSGKSLDKRMRNSIDSDFSPPRKSRGLDKNFRYSDSLSHRRNNGDSDSDLSLHSKKNSDKSYGKYDRDSCNKKYYKESRGSDYIKEKSKYEEQDRHFRKPDKNKYENSDDKSNKSKHDKISKTLEGKRAGLQNAKDLKKELTELKEKEDEVFVKLSSDLSGKGAATVMRDRKTGKIRNFEKERIDSFEKAKKSAQENEKYSKWGKGLKQVEDAAERVADAIHEMAKPLARYADDSDLDKLLKAQEREGDPMLDYIRSKQSESVSLGNSKPIYKGSYLPNRFNIRPGYRWDGVDRSNGFEKQWFTTQNNRKARDEEAYKWSVSDM